jgi:hypothetical protein
VLAIDYRVKMIHGASIVLSLVAVYCGKKPVITKLKITPWDVVGLDYYNSRIAVLLFTLNPSSGPFLSLWSRSAGIISRLKNTVG